MPPRARASWRRARTRRAWEREIADGNQLLSDRLNTELAPGADRLATELRGGQARLNLLRQPAQITESQTQAAWDTLNRMTIGKTDPLFAQALRQVGTALGAATGRNPLGGGSLTPGYNGPVGFDRPGEAGQAADGAARIAAGAREAAAGARELAAGARRLEAGLVELEAGTGRLERGLNRLAAGSEELRRGLARIRSGSSELAGGLASGHDQTAPLESGLEEGQGIAALRADQMRDRRGPFKQLRAMDQLNKKSPGFFESGYARVAALDGARALDNDASSFLVDSDKGGGEVGRVSILPNVPTNSPRRRR